jgi:hypothetical protein
MNMGVLGVPVVHRHPVKPRAEVAGGLVHQFPRKAPQARQLAGIVWRDDEPEMMPVPFAALGESPAVRFISGGIEQFPGRSIAGDAIALEIPDMGTQRAGRTHLANDASLDHGAAARRLEHPRGGEACRPSAPEPAATTARAVRKTTGLLRGLQRLRQK